MECFIDSTIKYIAEIALGILASIIIISACRQTLFRYKRNKNKHIVTSNSYTTHDFLPPYK